MYLSDIKYASAHVSNELDFKNVTENDGSQIQQVQVDGEDTVTPAYPIRLTDGLYGIGAWSQRIEEEVIFIGYEDDGTFDFTSWISSAQSMGCNESNYENVEKLKRSDTDGFIGMCFQGFTCSD